MKCSLIVVYTFAATLLFGCGGGGNESTNSPVSPDNRAVPGAAQAQQTIDARGGMLVLTTSDTSRFELTIPAGALTDSTDIVMRTDNATAEQHFVLAIEPAGLVFANGLQATLAIKLAADNDIPTTGSLIYDGVPVPSNRLSDGRLQIALSSFAGVASGAGISSSTRMTAQQLTRQSSPPSTCGSAPQAADFTEGSLTAANVVSIELYGQCMVGAVQALANRGDYQAAVNAATATAALLQRAGQQGNGGSSSALSFIQQASTIACTAMRAKLDAANAVTVSSMGSLYGVTKPIFFWQKIIEQLGAQCANVGATEYQTVVHAKISEALDFYNSERRNIVSTSSAQYAAAMSEAGFSRQALTQVRALQPSVAIQTTLTAEIAQRAQPGLLDAMLQAPFKTCRDGGGYAELIRLMNTLDAPARVKQAAQYCGATLNAQSVDAANAPIASMTQPLGGRLNGQTIEIDSAGAIQISKTGKLSLSGPIAALACPVGSASGSESLEIRFNNTLIQTWTSAPYISNALQLDIAQLLADAGIDAGNFTSGTLTLTRVGDPCGGFWGNHPQPLLALTVNTGMCQPQSGHVFCYTPIEISNDLYYKLTSLNDHGEVLFYEPNSNACIKSNNYIDAPCAGVWKSGQVRMLPNRFLPDGGMSNDGTAAGTQYSGANSDVIAVAKPGSATSIVLAMPIPQSNGDPPSGTGYSLDTISPNGRVTYHSVRGGYSYSMNDYGFCRTTSSTVYCWREEFFETSGSSYGAGASIYLSQLPAGPGRTTLYFDNDSYGRGGEIGSFSGNNIFASTDFIAGEAGIVVRMVDRNGARLIYRRADSTFELRGAAFTTPSGYQAYELGSNGHGVMCSQPDTNGVQSVRTFYTANQSVGNAVDQGITFQINGQQATAVINCGAPQRGERRIDGLGRILATAWSDSRPHLRAVILTPAGVQLP